MSNLSGIPPQYLLALGSGSTPVAKHNFTVTLTNGVNIVTQYREYKNIKIVLTPNDGYLPPRTITCSKPYTSYDPYTGTLKITMETTDITITGTCEPIPHTYSAINSFPLTHADMAAYRLTHDKLVGA